MRKNTRILLFIIAILLIASALGLSVYYRNVVQEKQKEQQIASVRGNTALSEYPQVQNIPPSDAYVNVPYSFNPAVVVKGDRNGLSYELVSSPDWLFLYNDRMFGIPSKGDIGEGKVVLRIHNRGVYMDYTFYVQVYEK